MAILSKTSTASIDAVSARSVAFVSGLIAGEALDAVSPCYVHSDGKVYMTVTSASTTLSTQTNYLGFCADNVALGDPVTLFGKGARFDVGSGLTAGTLYFSGSVAGTLSPTVVLSNDVSPLAVAVSATDIVVIR